MFQDGISLDDLAALSDELGTTVTVDDLDGDECDESLEQVTKLELYLSENRVQLLMDAPDPGNNPEGLARKVLLRIQSLELAEEASQEDILEAIESARKPDRDIREAVILEATAPVQPVDGRIAWQQDFFATGFVEDPDTGAIDYWNRLSDLSVMEGELLATVMPAKAGSDGVDLLGNAIKVDTPLTPQMSRGKGVESVTGEAGVEMRASISGRLRWANNVLAVDDVYTVSGSIGIETGNIDHPGAMIVSGDIQTGATIKADGDIMVMGMVEPCNIVTTGSLTVKGGLVGGEGSSIVTDGGVQAKYVLDCNIRAGEDIVVSNEITHSQITTRGSVLLPKGRIVGSKVQALGNIEVAQAGGEGLDTTWLVAAVDSRLNDDLMEPQTKLTGLEAIRLELREKVEARTAQGTPLTDKEKVVFQRIIAKSKETEEEIRKLIREINGIKKRSQHRAGDCIKVMRRIAADTILQVKEARVRVRRVEDSPRRAIYHKGKVVLTDIGEKMV